MAGIIDYVQQQITPETVNRISTEIGEDPAKTRQAINTSIPLLAGAISTQAPDVTQPSTSGGLADMISGASRAGGIGGALGGDSGGLLDSILGGSHATVQNDVSNASGIAPAKVMRILTMLAPLVLAAYARQKTGDATPSQPGTSTQGGGGLLGDIIDRVT